MRRKPAAYVALSVAKGLSEDWSLTAGVGSAGSHIAQDAPTQDPDEGAALHPSSRFPSRTWTLAGSSRLSRQPEGAG
jgi:hypothetical protein